MRNPVVIPLAWSEVILAANAGMMRRIYALREGKAGVDGAKDEGAWDGDINGAVAELACAKWANVYWNGTVGITTTSDVGKWQVRSKIVSGHRLVVKRNDKDHEVFVSVLVNLAINPTAVLCGWLHGWQAKNPAWLKTYPPKPPMYFVEDQYLSDMDELRGISDARPTPVACLHVLGVQSAYRAAAVS